MNNLNLHEKNIFSSKKSKMWINEAIFAKEQVTDYLKELPSGASVLEIGSGSGILLADLISSYEKLNIFGMEPYGPGFYDLKKYQDALGIPKNRLITKSFEDFESDKKFDFIFLINVFEHFKDWKLFLSFLKENLKEKGKCLILCPNYGFPYESHFHIPIIFNKKITKLLFKKYIYSFEEKHNCQGLWQDLNFVSWRQVRKEVVKYNLKANFISSITEDMINRLQNDDCFSQRQKKIIFIVNLVKKMNLLKLFRLKIMQQVSPYMKIELHSSLSE